MSRSFLFVWMDSFDLNQFFTNKLKNKDVSWGCVSHSSSGQVGNVFAAFHVKVVVVLFGLVLLDQADVLSANTDL